MAFADRCLSGSSISLLALANPSSVANLVCCTFLATLAPVSVLRNCVATESTTFVIALPPSDFVQFKAGT